MNTASEFDRFLSPVHLIPAYQPVLDLTTNHIVGFEALARWPALPGANPGNVFTAARAAGRLPELEWAARTCAISGALAAELGTEYLLFVNVEVGVPGQSSHSPERAILDEGSRKLRIVAELTERSLLHHPAALFDLVEWIRSRNWLVALDDVGSQPESLTLLPFIKPDIVKLDKTLIQHIPTAEQMRTIQAVMAYAERNDTIIVAEGIETPTQLAQARALGAHYGQGWLLGHPGQLHFPGKQPPVVSREPRIHPPHRATPFGLLSARLPARDGSRSLLKVLSHDIEEQAFLPSTTALLATFQTSDRFTPRMAARYSEIAKTVPFVGVLGVGLDHCPAPGVRGACLAASDPLRGEWVVAAIGTNQAVALTARDLDPDGPTWSNRYAFVVTHDHDLAVAAAQLLMAKVAEDSNL